jgi:hypothetical protein
MDKSEVLRCFGATENELFLLRNGDNNTKDIWLYNIEKNSYKKITNDGKDKRDIYYSRY